EVKKEEEDTDGGSSRGTN
ncbi:hypothetical protein L195_g033182, partial [Trifolium pratense]